MIYKGESFVLWIFHQGNVAVIRFYLNVFLNLMWLIPNGLTPTINEDDHWEQHEGPKTNTSFGRLLGVLDIAYD